MGSRSTRVKVVFLTLLVLGFVAIQVSWMTILFKDNQEAFKTRMINGVYKSAESLPVHRQAALNNKDISNLLTLALLSNGLGDHPFEFSMHIGKKNIVSDGYTALMKTTDGHLIMDYIFPANAIDYISNDQLTVVIPSWKSIILYQMKWVFVISITLTLMLVFIFFYALVWGERRQRLFYNGQSAVIKNMIQQLETPLTTVSVAAEALRNEQVQHDKRKTNYYQQIITEQNKRMKEQVDKSLGDLK